MGYTPSRWRSSGKLHIPDIHILRRPVASRPCPRLAQTMPRTPRSRLKKIILCIILPNHELFVSFIHRDFRISLGKMAARRKTSLPSSFCRDILDAKVIWNALLLQMYDSAPDTWHCSRCTIVLQIHDSAPDVWQYSTCMTVLQMYVSAPDVCQWSLPEDDCVKPKGADTATSFKHDTTHFVFWGIYC